MNKKSFYYPSSDGKTQIHAIRWEPEGKPKAILQIIHGMVEFIDRYDPFATYMADHGWLVTGEDHLGHGESVVADEYHGYFGNNGNACVIADIHKLREMTQEEFPDVPYTMLGHSMGSFLIRQYITEQDGDYAKGLAGVIVMGTGWQPNGVLRFGKLVARMGGLRKIGKRAKFIDMLSFGSNLKKIENPKYVADWLTKDEAIVEWYMHEPWCQFHFTPNGYFNMFDGMLKAHDKKRMGKLPAGLPILITSGAEDPVGAWGEGVRKTFIAYTDNSPCEVSIKMYDDDRHEILNELDKDQVWADMLEFLEGCIA